MSDTDDRLLADIAYHLDLATHLSADGDHGQASSEAALAHALLVTRVDLPGRPEVGDLPGAEALTADGEAVAPIRARARALALELTAHFVSEGQHERADAYQAAATWLDG